VIAAEVMEVSLERRNQVKAKLMALLISAALTAPFFVGAVGAQDEELKVDLNRASIEELVELPGVGEKVAERIVTYREENGRFEAPEELMNVRGIGEKTYLKLEPYLVVSKEMDERQ
jgi:competence protein ComEA